MGTHVRLRHRQDFAWVVSLQSRFKLVEPRHRSDCDNGGQDFAWVVPLQSRFELDADTGPDQALCGNAESMPLYVVDERGTCIPNRLYS